MKVFVLVHTVEESQCGSTTEIKVYATKETARRAVYEQMGMELNEHDFIEIQRGEWYYSYQIEEHDVITP